MLPSFGSTSSPAEVPHLRPAGSSPQLRVTFGAGFGSPSPVIGFATFAADCADNVTREAGLLYAVSNKTAQAPTVESPATPRLRTASRIRDVRMAISS